MRTDELHEPHVIAFARLSLFGEGARRLHDELVSVVAPWAESEPSSALAPLPEAQTTPALAALDRALIAAATNPSRFPEAAGKRLARRAAADYAALWPALDAEADAHAAQARVDLEARGRKDAEELAAILRRQMEAIDKRVQQLSFDLGDQGYSRDEKTQLRRDQEHMAARRRALDGELLAEPQAVQALFEVTLQRVTPVGLVYLWPETRG